MNDTIVMSNAGEARSEDFEWAAGLRRDGKQIYARVHLDMTCGCGSGARCVCSSIGTCAAKLRNQQCFVALLAHLARRFGKQLVARGG